MNLTPLFSCPHCGGSFLVISEWKAYCLSCRLSFNRKLLEKIAPENVLSDEELEAITKSLAAMAGGKNQN
jgi:hypothetical protein